MLALPAGNLERRRIVLSYLNIRSESVESSTAMRLPDTTRFPSLSAQTESRPVGGSFTISRRSKTGGGGGPAARSDGRQRGRGECVPCPGYGEADAGGSAAVKAMREPLGRGLDGADPLDDEDSLVHPATPALWG